jgi:oligoendopeptidase F
VEKLVRPSRIYLPDDFKLESWQELKPWFEKLLQTDISDANQLKTWLLQRSELESVIAEDMAWRYIRMTCYTDNQEYNKAYQDFVQNIQPEIAPYSDQLNKKAAACPFLSELESEMGYDIMIKNLKKEIEIFREENIPLFTDITTETQKYAQISGDMSVKIDDKELTLQQAGVLLMDTNRAKREEVYNKISKRRLTDKEKLDELFSQLITLRHQVALNADFSNFRDFMFKALGRFDYTPQDCFDFHNSIAHEVRPLLDEFMLERKQKLGYEVLRPWDKLVDPEGKSALKAFENGTDLTDKAIEVFKRLDPFLGQCLSVMKAMGHLDLESRMGKAPGGYNYPLAEIGVPFIFMNATSTLRDMVTIMHEGGHAIHNFVTKDLALQDFKSTPSEVAELASMAMELISMDHWDVFFEDSDDLKRAKREHLEDLIETLPWVATIDKFQHWIYENPNHSNEARKQNWNRILDEFNDSITDWSGWEEAKDYLWQKQLHLYEVPFYYIEYGMAQLGAIAVWRNYKMDNKKGLESYLNALKLGYMKSIPEIYAAAGIKFDFSRAYINELIHFVKQELNKLQ